MFISLIKLIIELIFVKIMDLSIKKGIPLKPLGIISEDNLIASNKMFP